jgi:hypothetical protein
MKPRLPIRICDYAGCGREFQPLRSDHVNCSEACRSAKRRKGAMVNDTEGAEMGGIQRDGAMVSGTIWARPEYDPRNPPQHDARFW